MGQASTTPGWYPDPFGETSNFRWWNGTGWTVAVADTLWAPEPADPAPYTPARTPVMPSDPMPLTLEAEDLESPRRRGLWITAIALAAVLVVSAGVVWLGSGQRTSAESDTPTAGGQQAPAGRATNDDEQGDGGSGGGHGGGGDDAGGRGGGPEESIPSGPLTFRSPGPAWQVAGTWVLRENLRREHGMVATTEPEYEPGHSWQATIVAGDLPEAISTDGAMEKVAKRAARWFVRTEWNTEPSAEPTAGRAIRVDGRPAWELTTEVAYDIDGVRATHDEVEIVVIDYGPDEEYGLVIASVPNTDQQLWNDVKQAVRTAGRGSEPGE